MTAYLVRRVTAAIALLFGVTFITFLLFVQIPVNPGYARIGFPPKPNGVPGQLQKYNAELKRVDHELGADRPVAVQYLKYLQGLAKGSLGRSAMSDQPVRDMLGPALGVTAALVFGGILLLFLIAVPLGTLAALRTGGMLDRGLLGLALVAASIPPYILSLLLLVNVSRYVGLAHTDPLTGLETETAGYCPLFGHSAGGLPGGVLGGPSCGGPADWAKHLILPWIAFAAGLVAIYMRMVRAAVVEALDEPHVQTARAKGASEWRVVRAHVLRTAAAPIATMLAMDIGMALGIALYVEVVFGLNGLGWTAWNAMVVGQTGFDLPVIAGVTLISAVAIVCLNLVVDLVCGLLDPRIRLGYRRG
jgi:peptide/nickel transport system permease protein